MGPPAQRRSGKLVLPRHAHDLRATIACDRVPDPHREFAGQLPVRRRGVEVSLVGERRTGKHKLDVP
jgi:hypothetical protein